MRFAFAKPQATGCQKPVLPDHAPHTPAAGIATCRLRGDVKALQAALELPQEQMSTPHAGLFPEFEHLEVPPEAVSNRPSATARRPLFCITHGVKCPSMRAHRSVLNAARL